MHKSVGNVIYLRDLMKEGWEPMTIRTFLIAPKYRDSIDLTEAGLQQARAQLARLSELVERLGSVTADGESGSRLAKSLLDDFEEAMDEDLNTPKAFSVLFTVAKKANTLIDSGEMGREAAKKLLEALQRVNSVLGVLDFGKKELEPRLLELLAKREEARERKDFAESDRLRKELLAAGIVVEDTPSGPRWKRTGRG